MLKGNFLMQYRKKETGALMFIYTVKGSAAELGQYKETQGENLRLDEAQNPLFYVQAFANGKLKNLGKVISITRTGGDNPRYVWDNSDLMFNALQKANEMLPQELAKQLADAMMNDNSRTATAPTIAPGTAILASAENAVVANLETEPVEQL